jgi:DNA-binding GntR family transcriptional regulator
VHLERGQPLYEQAYAALRKAILEAKLAPGERLVETRLATMLNTSRTPIRESIRQLERDGLVTSSPHDGAYVRRPDRTDLVNLYLCRSSLERVAITVAAERADAKDLESMADALAEAEQAIKRSDPFHFLDCNSRFHRRLDLAAHNDRLDELLERARAPLLLYRAMLVRHGTHHPLVLSFIHGEHVGLLAAVRSGDVARAQEAMEAHMKNDLSRIILTIQDFGL